jgi:NADH-quinone oxidoreductase subunit M
MTPEAMHQTVVAAIVAVVAAPLLAAAVLRLGFARNLPRLPAVAAAATALVSSGLLLMAWHSAGSVSLDFGDRLAGGGFIHVDGITVILLPYSALAMLAVVTAAPKRFLDAPATARLLLGMAATFALFVTAHPLAIVGLWAATGVPAWASMRAHPGGRPTARVFASASIVSLIALVVGTVLMLVDPPWERGSGWQGTTGGWLVAFAVAVREGLVPVHSWYPAVYGGAPMSTALLVTVPQVGSYTAVRLLIGHADGVAHELVVLSQLGLVTAVYGAALAVVQRDLRWLIGMLAMSQSALVMGGLAGTLSMELNGAFCMWISSGLSLTGIGLVAWALESRAGTIRLDTPQGRFWDAPALAAFFLLFGLAGIGLPGTLSFVADDLIVSGSLDEQLHAGLLVIAATVLGGISLLRGWFMVFGGPVAADGPRHAILVRERTALSLLLVVLFGLGLFPAALVRSVDRATSELLGSSSGRATDGQLHEPPGDR